MKQMYLFRIVAVGRWFAVFLLALAFLPGAQAQVSGVVFRDFDLNGVRSDTLPIEAGVKGVLVRAFIDISRTPVLTNTDADGRFSFSSAQAPAGMPVRIEFGNLPTGDYEGPFGSGSGTRVQFVTAGASATAVQVSLNYPADYCQKSGVQVVTPCYVNGNANKTTNDDGSLIDADKQSANGASLVSFAYEASGVTSASNFPTKYLATAGQTGAVWGLAFQRKSKKLFSAAVLKRHTSYGPLGPGGIYQTDMTTGLTTNFLDVSTIGIDMGNDSHSGLLGNKLLPSADPGPMQDLGKKSFGGIDMSEDDKTIYFVNLSDRKIYGVFVDSPARTPTSADVKSWAIPNPGCSDNDFRPWALKVYRGKIYVGVICSAETSQDSTKLSATIYRFDPTATTSVFENILSFPLNFRRGPADNTANCVQYDHWLPWTDKWPTPCGEGANPYFVMYPQPMLADMEFEADGSMLIGFLDRFGSMSGDQNHDPSGNGNYDGFTGGDLLVAYNNNGTFELEKNGKSGPLTGSGVGNKEGPGGGEFFGLDNWFFIDHIAHSEVTNGALTLIPGYNEILTSAFDPIENVYKAGGLKVFNLDNGQVKRNYVIYTQLPGSFGKASGLGDSKALCDPAPVQIGNRVWFDDNRDGIQDAYEPGIDGIVLTLHDMDNGGARIATQTTHDGGQYYFSSTTVPGGLMFNHKYEVRMDVSQLPLLDITLNGTRTISSFGGGSGGGRLAARAAGGRVGAVGDRSYTISALEQTDGNDDASQRNSKATVSGNSAVMPVTTGDAGQNSFIFDLSMYSCPILVPERRTVDLCSGTRLDSIVADGLHLSKTDQVQFVLFTSPQSGTAMYSGGTVLGTVTAQGVSSTAISTTALSTSATADSIQRAVLRNPAINTINNTATVQKQYIYAIVFPLPADPNCRQSAETEIIISPSLKARATSGSMTCSTTAVTLTGDALYGDGTPAPNATYAWTGPDSFTSSQQNPTVSVAGTYTLTVGDGTCPASTSTTTTEVTSNTVVPTLTTTVTAKTCPTCQATLTANAPGAALAWTGPSSFTATGSPVQATDPGEYTVTATGTNSCQISARLRVTEFNCPDPDCLPVRINRIR